MRRIAVGGLVIGRDVVLDRYQMRISCVGGRGKGRLWYIWCGSGLGHDWLRSTNRINLLSPVEAFITRSNNTGGVGRLKVG